MIPKLQRMLVLIILTSLSACSFSRKITFNRLSNEEVCQLETGYYPMAREMYRIRNGISKEQMAAQYLDQVSFVNIYDPEGQLVASTGTGTCEFKILSMFKGNALQPD